MQIFTGKHSIKSESVILRGLVASLLLACSISLFRHGMGQKNRGPRKRTTLRLPLIVFPNIKEGKAISAEKLCPFGQ